MSAERLWRVLHMFLNTRGLILREAKYKESDKILTILTETDGKITAKARGVARTRSKLAAATQLLTFADFTLFGNKGYYTVNEAATVEQFRPLRSDIGLLALGSYIAEQPEQVDRLPLEAIVHEEVYHDYTPQDIDRLYAYKESLPENKQFILENNKETLAQVFTDVRYTKKDSEAMSENLWKIMKKQGF